MVAIPLPDGSHDLRDDRIDEYYDDLARHWPERPARKRARRAYQRKQERRIVLKAERVDPPDTARMSKALLAAQRELARAQAETQAESQAGEDARAQQQREQSEDR